MLPALALYSHFQTYAFSDGAASRPLLSIFVTDMLVGLIVLELCTCVPCSHNNGAITSLPSGITIVPFRPPLLYSFKARNCPNILEQSLGQENCVTFSGLPYEVFGLVVVTRSTIVARNN